MRDHRLHVDRVLCNKWRLLMRLGEGGVSNVWAGEHRNGLRVAIKVLRPELSADGVVRGRFLREGYVANRIRHPGVVPVLDDDCTDDGIVFLVMELLRGETLKQRVRRQGLFTPHEVVKIAIEVLRILEAAHAQHVLHRDIKPDNVFLLSDGSLRLLDFGVARLRELGVIDHETKKGAMLGTPAFMPPEQALGHWDRVDVRSEVFALGATMWNLLSGRLVHRATTTQEMLIASSTLQARPIGETLPDLPLGVARIIDKALAFDPNARWDSASHMREALEEVDELDFEETQRLEAVRSIDLHSRVRLAQ